MANYQGGYEINTLVLVTRGDVVDLKDKLINFEIYEDIHSPFLLGFVDLFDMDTIVETGSIVGEEEYVNFDLTITGTFGQASRKIEGTLYVYKIEDEHEIKNKGDAFRLRLVSKEFFLNSKARNRKFYEATQSDIVAEIVEAQLESELIRVDPTELEQRYIFPNWHPVSCIYSMAENSRSAGYRGEPDYVFYQDLEGFHYVSMSYMIDEGNGLAMPFIGDKWFKNEIVNSNVKEKHTFNIISHHKKQAFDIVDNVNRGMYGASQINHNLAKRKWRHGTSSYAETFGSFEHLADNELSLRGGDYVKNRMQLIPSNTFGSGVYPEEVYPEDVRKIAIRQLQTEQNLFVLHIQGEAGKVGNELKVGRPMYFDLRSKKGKLDDNTDNDLLHGKFLITRIRHSFTNDKYWQFLEMAKDSYETWI